VSLTGCAKCQCCQFGLGDGEIQKIQLDGKLIERNGLEHLTVRKKGEGSVLIYFSGSCEK
jgi:hypothetical protein